MQIRIEGNQLISSYITTSTATVSVADESYTGCPKSMCKKHNLICKSHHFNTST
jgi:hypothetical protein